MNMNSLIRAAILILILFSIISLLLTGFSSITMGLSFFTFILAIFYQRKRS